MDRRTFLQVSATGALVAGLAPLSGCADADALATVEAVAGPSALAADGTRWEARAEAHQLVRVDGAAAQRIGRVGAALGQLNYPVGVALAGGLVYVVERGNHRVQVFGDDGAARGVVGVGELLYPGALLARGDELVVADSWRGRLVVFGAEGAVRRVLGVGELSAPRGLAMLGGELVVADVGRREVLVLDEAGRVARALGGGWTLPTSLAADGDTLYVGDEAAARLVALDARGDVRGTIPLERAPRFLSLAGPGRLLVA